MMTREEFEECINMIRSEDAMTYEDGYSWIQDNIMDFFDEIVQILRDEKNPFIRAKFVEIIGDSMNERAIPILREELNNSEREVRSWAWSSLMSMKVKTAEHIAKEYQVKHPEEDFYYDL